MQLTLLTEHQQLEGLANNDRKITELIYRNNYKQVQALVQNKGGNSDDGDDVFQEAMTVLFQKAQQEDFRLSCKIGTYLVAVAKFIWYKKLQQQNRRPDYVPFDSGSDEKGESHQYEDDIKVQKERELHFAQLDVAMDDLGEPCASLLKAFYHENKSMQEIALRFGYTNPDNAKTQKYKCLSRLKKLFYTEKVHK
ncbi:MAG: sigma-70 family RNA polymerase sigma factor [Chitinophagaceae bacterium]|nr:sigma-70 family RNA polymerase sigma factor [Chitinophagaceae bacterium]